MMLQASEVLQCLSCQQFLSGQRLADRFNVTRATINNHISKLQALGIAIESVSGCGYRLCHPISLHDKNYLLEALRQNAPAPLDQIQCWQQIESTNTAARALATPESGAFSIVLAELQTAGRGRRGRTWLAPYAANITLSVVWNLQRPLHAAGLLSPYIAVQIAKVLDLMGLPAIKVKWPNDIYCNAKKIAGILIECSGEMNSDCHLVVGLGINAYMSQSSLDFSQHAIEQPWTDIISELPDFQSSRDDIAIACINAIVAGLISYEQGVSKTFDKLWSQWDLLHDKPVRVESETNTITGIARGINPQGCLRLYTPTGEEQIMLGEVSLRADHDNTD